MPQPLYAQRLCLPKSTPLAGHRETFRNPAVREETPNVGTARALTLTAEPPYRPGMGRRRFLLTSLAGAIAAPLAAVANSACQPFLLFATRVKAVP